LSAKYGALHQNLPAGCDLQLAGIPDKYRLVYL